MCNSGGVGFTGNQGQSQANAINNQAGCSKPDAKDSARSLARLMEKQLGYAEGHIDAIALRLFIRAYWSRVATFAHAIHEEEA